MHDVYPNGDEVSNVDIVYLCKDYSGQLKACNREVSDLRFFTLDQRPENLSQPNKPAIKKFVERRADSKIFR